MQTLVQYNELLLYLLRFFVGSTLLIGSVYLLQRTSIIKKRDLIAVAYKAAVVASLSLLLPFSTTLSPTIAVAPPQVTSVVGELPAQKTEVGQAKNHANNEIVDKPTLASDLVQRSEQPLTQSSQPIVQNNTAPLFAKMPLMLPLLPVLFFGLAAALVGLLVHHYKTAISRIGERSLLAPSSPAYLAMEKICEQGNIRKLPKLTHAENIDSPLCLPRGEICLPSWALTSQSQEQLSSLIAHELAHYKNGDAIKLLLMALISRVFFWQPLFALANKQLTQLAEFAADEWAAKHSTNPKAVAKALYQCAQHISQQQQPQWGLAMAREKSALKARVETLLEAQKSSFQSTGKFVKATTVAAIVTVALSVPGLALVSPTTHAGESGLTGLFDSDTERTSYRHRNGDHEIRVDRKGEISLDSNASRVGSVSSGGYFKLCDTGDDIDRCITYRDDNGTLDITFERDGDEMAMAADDEAWLDKMMLNYLRTSGDHAKQRVKTILANQGVDALLVELTHVSNHALRYYGAEALNSGKLDTEDLSELIAILGKIDSDYDMRMAFTPLVLKDGLDQSLLQDMFKALKSMSSDYEMRVLLSEMLKKKTLNDETFTSFVKLSHQIDSDYEMRVLLTIALAEQPMNQDNLVRFIKLATKRISSDYELRVLLGSLNKTHLNQPNAIKEIIKGLSSIESSYELRVAIESIVKDAKMDSAAWAELITALAHISSSYEAAEATLAILKVIPKDRALLNAIDEFAEENIHSEYERNRVKNALVKAYRES